MFIASAMAIVAPLVIDSGPPSTSEQWVELAQPPARSGSLQALTYSRAPPVSLSPDN